MGTRIGQRGKTLQRLVDMSNRIYFRRGTADIREVPVPIQITKMDHKTGKIKDARLKKGEFVDYLGIAGNGRAVAFDAKETAITTNFPLMDNLHDHQFEMLKSWHEKGAYSFLLVSFSKLQYETYVVPFVLVQEYWEGAKNGGRKSIPYDVIARECERAGSENGLALHYLKGMFAEDESGRKAK